jgi:hypothetical protein
MHPRTHSPTSSAQFPHSNKIGVEVAKPANYDAWKSDDIVTVRCPHAPSACKMSTLIREVKLAQDSTGGVVAGVGTPYAAHTPVRHTLCSSHIHTHHAHHAHQHTLNSHSTHTHTPYVHAPLHSQSQTCRLVSGNLASTNLRQ